MKSAGKLLIFPLIPILFWVSTLDAQKRYDPQKVVHNELMELILAHYGPDFQYVGYSILDTLVHYSSRDLENIRDPYGTLKGCILFSTYKNNGEAEPDTFIVGMVRDNQIIWDNAPGTTADLGGRLLYAQDIDNDGEVDLLVSERDREFDETKASPLYYLYALSWNGAQGRFINAFDHITSAIIGDGSFELVDKDGDGVQEIMTSLPDVDMDWGDYRTSTYPYVTYGLKSGQYGLWPGVEQIRGDEFLPANRMNITVKCSVEENGGQYYYDYSVHNDSTSRQIVSDIYIAGLEDTTSSLAPPMWQSGSSSYVGGRAFIKYSAGTYYLIHPGQTVDGFKTISPALPTIVSYHVQGYTRPIFVSADRETENILNNSVTGFTLGTRDTAITLGALQWLDTLTSFTTQSRSLGWIKDQATADKYSGYFASAKGSLQQNNTTAARTVLQQALQQVNIDSTNNLTSEAYALIRYNTEYLLTQLPTTQPGLVVKLINSTGEWLTTGSLQYYEGSWKDATDNNDGTFAINTTVRTLSLRMTYEYSTQTKSNVTVGQDTAVFQTVNAQIELQDSKGNPMDAGAVKYYAGAWRNFGTTTNGIASKELLPNNYTFRMTYAYGSSDKQQNIGSDPTVVFRTVSAAVQLEDSHGSPIDQGTVKYYAGAWRDFGTTTSGVATKELLPNNYSFRMTYAYGSNDKRQDIGGNPTVVFQTVNAAVRLEDSQGTPMDQGTVQYYAGAWRDFGTTSGGVTTKELLPNKYSFRMTYAYASNDKQQDIAEDPTVVFQTVKAAVQLKDSQGNLIGPGTVQYYAGAWRGFGTASSGVATKELLPANYTFRMTYEFVTSDKAQDISANATVAFSTFLCTIRVVDSQNQPVDNVQASYYSGGWRQIGSTVNGQVMKELLPANLTFRINYGANHQDKTQNLSSNSLVEFSVP